MTNRPAEALEDVHLCRCLPANVLNHRDNDKVVVHLERLAGCDAEDVTDQTQWKALENLAGQRVDDDRIRRAYAQLRPLRPDSSRQLHLMEFGDAVLRRPQTRAGGHVKRRQVVELKSWIFDIVAF